MSASLTKIQTLLTEHKFKIISNINDDLKCVICNKILVNAQQSLCGCHFCLVCINNYKNSGSKNCPGNTDECKSDGLKTVFPDTGSNKHISNLIVQCPYERCSHECQLIKIEDHLRLCSIRNVNCPFNNVGCEHGEMNIDKLNDHMLSEIVNHNKILIDIIGNLRNEVRELKEKEEINRKEIEILKTNDCKKDENLEWLNKEIILIKKEKEDLAGQMDICNSNLWNSFDKIDKEMKEKCTNDVIKSINEDIKLLKMKKEELSQQIDNLKSNFDEKFNVEMNARLNEMKQEWREKFEIQTIETNKINEYLNMKDNGELLWQIGKISEIELIISEYFIDKQNPYKMIAFDEDLKWPCRANIKINIFAYDDNNLIDKSVTKSLMIDKPENNSFKRSDSIKFFHSGLKKSKQFNKNCLLVCRVGFH